MTKISANFKFTIPSGWNEALEGERLIFHGPQKEELIISGSTLAGYGTVSELERLQRRSFENASQAVKNAANHSALKVMQDLHRESRVLKVECWSLISQTHDQGTLFHQFVFQSGRGVLLVTFEGPNTSELMTVIEQFLQSVEPVADGEAIVE